MVGSSGSAGRHLEICWPNHHGCGLERVARTLPVVPLDAVEFVCTVLLWVVLSIQVGRTTCIKPPACESEAQKESGVVARVSARLGVHTHPCGWEEPH